MAALWLDDRLSGLRVAGMLIGLAGVVVLSWDRLGAGSTAAALPVLACLGATLCYGIAASYTKRFLTGVPPLVTATGTLLGASLALLLPAAARAERDLPDPRVRGGLWHAAGAQAADAAHAGRRADGGGRNGAVAGAVPARRGKGSAALSTTGDQVTVNLRCRAG